MTGRISAPNLASLFAEAGERWGDLPAFSSRRHDGTFFSISYRQWRDRSINLATALIELGVESKDHVAILSDNRFEWILSDAAVQFCGAADVPRAADVTEGEIAYILDHADVAVALVENAAVLAKTLSGCKLVLPSDPRAANCKAASSASFVVDAKEIGRLRNEQVAQRGATAGGDATNR